jgi:flagella synthesis protein FlgN
MINKTFPIAEKLLENGFGLSKDLLVLLTKESDNLKHRANADAINKITDSKEQTVLQLDQFSKQMSQILSTEKLQMTPQGMAEYFTKAKSVDLDIKESSRMWDEIISITRQCRLLNEKNGASISLLAQNTQNSLHILKGKPYNPTTYGPDGATQSEQHSHSLVSV